MSTEYHETSTGRFALSSVPKEANRKMPQPADADGSNLICVLQKEVNFRENRRIKILEYAQRYSKRTDTEKESDFEDINEEQEEWVKKRITAPSWAWQRWDGIIEEWTPWNRFGDPINQWRCYKK
jgi:hypothetical protein